MGLLDIFRRKSTGGISSEMKKKLSQMSVKRVNYVYMPIDELSAAMQSDTSFAAKLVPVNYYALKSEYIEAVFYSDVGHEENYVIFRTMKNDVPVMQSGIFSLDKDTLRKVYSRLGAVDF
ncbi:MAG: hypothetical protein ACI4SF_14510 [Oscillospiraceae bacterium]